MTVSARIINKHFALTIRASVEMGAELCGATGAEVMECLPLAIRQGVVPAWEKRLFVLTKDLGNGGPRQAHWSRVLPVDSSKAEIASVSKGLVTVCNRRVDTRK